MANVIDHCLWIFINYDKNGTMIGTSQPVTAGLIVGLIMGDLKTGLYIGATLQLMTLGISSFGGLLCGLSDRCFGW